MGLECFSIVLNPNPNPSGVYLPGQVVSGYVEIWNKHSKTFNGSKLKFQGFSNVEWSEGSGYDETTYNAAEYYFKVEQPLVQGQGTSRVELAAGQHQIPFNFLLPIQIPSSFEGTHGHVRYRIKAFLKGTFMKIDYKQEILIPVNTIVDLNINLERAMMPQQKSLVKERSEGTGSIVATASIERTGYCTGETLIYNAKIENQSNKSCCSSTVQVVQKTQFRAKSRANESRTIIWEQTRGKIRSSEVETWNNIPITLPPLPPSDLPFCNIIDISYEIELIIKPGTFSSNLTLPLEILIGNVPLNIPPLHLSVYPGLEPPFQPQVQQERPTAPASLTVKENFMPTPTDFERKLDPLLSEKCPQREVEGFSGHRDDEDGDYADFHPPSYEKCHEASIKEKNVDQERI